MYTLISICDLNLWHILFSWLLPFLFGLLLGWLLWGAYKRKFNEAANERDDLYDDLIKSKEELEICREQKVDKKVVASSSEGKSKKQEISSDPGRMAFGIPTSKFSALDHDNLQIIEGVGPKMSEYLHSNGINSWETLAGYDEHYLKKLLHKEGNKYRIIDPNSWPAQANLASKGEWEKLIVLQKSLVSGKKKAGSVTDSKVEKMMVRLGLLKKWAKDDLKAIEGIGPKIEKLLFEAGINTWQLLADSDVAVLEGVLEKAGKRYQLADPGTWPQQAKLAAEGNWNELEILQDQLKGGKKV